MQSPPKPKRRPTPESIVLKFDRVEFEDCNGCDRIIRSLPLTKRRDYELWLSKAMQIKLDSELETIAHLYDNHKKFRQYCNKCLKLFKIKPKWIDIKLLKGLLFANGERQGALTELEEFSLIVPESLRKGIDDDPYYAQLGMLINVCGGNVESGMKVAESYSYNEVQRAIASAVALRPKTREEEIADDLANVDKAELVKELAEAKIGARLA